MTTTFKRKRYWLTACYCLHPCEDKLKPAKARKQSLVSYTVQHMHCLLVYQLNYAVVIGLKSSIHIVAKTTFALLLQFNSAGRTLE